MDIQLLAIDVDGTLVGSDNIVSKANAEAVQKARELGVKIVLCTGRLHCETEYAAVQLGGCDYMVTCNGSVVFDLVNRRHIFIDILPYSLVDRVIRTLESYDILYQIYTDDVMCIPARQFHKFDDVPLTVGYREMFRESQLLLENPRADIPDKKMDVLKFFVPNFDTELLYDIRSRINQLPGLEVTFSSEYGLEIFREGLDKFTGLNRLLKHLDISYDNVMVLGDSENDLQIIRAARYGTAMENAPDFVKNAASFHTKSNEEDGVADAVRRMILEPAGVSLGAASEQA